MPQSLSVVVSEAGWRLPVPVSREVVLADGPNLEVVGGLDSAGASSSAVVTIDPVTGAARPSGTLATPIHDAAGAMLGAELFVFGGGAASITSSVQHLHPGSRATVTARLPGPRSDLVAVTVGGIAYLVGGYDGAILARAVLSTSDGAAFTTVANLPVPVRYPAVATIGTVLWVFGGQTATGSTDAVQRIDISTGQASVAYHLPATLTDASAVVLGGQIFLLGGLVAGHPTDTVVRYDTNTGSQAVVAHLPAPVHDAAAAVIADTAFLLGGEAPNTVSTVIRLQLTTTAAPPVTP